MKTIEELINQLAAAKHAESKAKTARLQAEDAVLAALELPEKGSRTIAGDGIKLTVTTGLTYKANMEYIEKIDSDFVIVKEVKDLHVAAYEDCRKNNPELFAKLSQHVTVSSKKPTLSIKLG